LRQSDRDLDLAIDGAGFLVLLKDADTYFARTGTFEVNEDGDIVLAGTDYKLAVLDETGTPTAISVAPYRTSPPQATTRVTLADNLSSSATTFSLPGIKVYDAQGVAETWQITFERSASAPGEWTVRATNSAGSAVGESQALRFIAGIVDPATTELRFESGGRSVTLDLSKNVSSFSSGEVSTLRVASVDGHGVGTLTGAVVNEDGALELAYSNEQTRVLGPIAIGSFRDPGALVQLGSGLFNARTGARVDYQSSASDDVGKVLGKRLEASNVDLSQEFGELILVQRGYQAASQVVSASNEMIQQLFGIRGQG